MCPTRSRFVVSTAIATLLCAAVAAPSAAEDAVLTEEQKTLYYLGMLAARPLLQFDLDDEELKTVQQGLADAVTGNSMELDPQIYGTRAQAMMKQRAAEAAAKEMKASEAFIAAEAAKPGVRKLASGMLVEDIELGTGEKPTVNDTVVVHYHGTLRDGKVFDSSVERKQPFRTQLTRVVKCWQEGVATMRVGGKSRLICPSDLAYGTAGSPPLIQGGAARVFEVELLNVEK